MKVSASSGRPLRTRRAAAVTVALTGWGQDRDRQRSLEAAFDAPMTTPRIRRSCGNCSSGRDRQGLRPRGSWYAPRAMATLRDVLVETGRCTTNMNCPPRRHAHVIPAMWLILVLAGGVATPGAASQATTGATRAEWRVYRNDAFGYEIRYPPGFEVWPTGREGERNGGAIRIGRTEFAAPTPMLDISVGIRLARGLPANPPGLRVLERDAIVNGVRFREMTYRWEENGEIAFVELRHARALLVFHAPAGLQDFHETVWWSIMSGFRFLDQ
jgi:hypothetical protein